MKDIKILETCEYCGEHLTLMESINTDTNKLMLVKRCLNCGQRQVEEVAELKVIRRKNILNKRIRKKKKSFPIKSVAKIKLNEGETLAIICGDEISIEKQYHMTLWLRKIFPNNNVMILPKDYKIKVISTDVVTDYSMFDTEERDIDKAINALEKLK